MDHSKIRLNLHIYPSFFTNESRILRETETLISHHLFDEIVLIGFWKAGLPKREALSTSIEVVRITTHLGKNLNFKWLNLFSFFIFYIKVLGVILKHRPVLINAHSLTVLPICVFSKWLLGSKLIYDAHELETETNDSKGIRKKAAKIIEKLFIKQADYIIVVSNSIRDWYMATYQIDNVGVIKNVPTIPSTAPLDQVLRQTLNIQPNEILFIYSGILSKGRGIEILLEIFKTMPSLNLVLMGYGPLKEKVLQYCSNHSNIRLLEAVNPKDVTRYISGADVGISFIENTCLSYYYSLPNKVFEYISAGVPFICSGFPDVEEEFKALNISWFVSNQNNLRNMIQGITREQILIKRNNVSQHRLTWGWDKESVKLIDIYKNIFPSPHD